MLKFPIRLCGNSMNEIEWIINLPSVRSYEEITTESFDWGMELLSTILRQVKLSTERSGGSGSYVNSAPIVNPTFPSEVFWFAYIFVFNLPEESCFIK